MPIPISKQVQAIERVPMAIISEVIMLDLTILPRSSSHGRLESVQCPCSQVLILNLGPNGATSNPDALFCLYARFALFEIPALEIKLS